MCEGSGKTTSEGIGRRREREEKEVSDKRGGRRVRREVKGEKEEE